MSVRFRVCLAVWIATVICSVACGTSFAEVYDVGDGWSIEVSPAVKATDLSHVVPDESVALSREAAADDGADVVDLRTSGQDYRRIYSSIPFNRAEYNVNPSYRHDSTMELLTGNARHQTIVRHSTERPVYPRRRYGYIPYRYNNPRYGLNYYFYFPYWNYRGIY